MTPKEKALDLETKFLQLNYDWDGGTNVKWSKEGALIAVDEMIAFIKLAFSYINIELASPSIKYLKEVKQEIEKL